jgi:hypothetical protein
MGVVGSSHCVIPQLIPLPTQHSTPCKSPHTAISLLPSNNNCSIQTNIQCSPTRSTPSFSLSPLLTPLAFSPVPNPLLLRHRRSGNWRRGNVSVLDGPSQGPFRGFGMSLTVFGHARRCHVVSVAAWLFHIPQTALTLFPSQSRTSSADSQVP